MENNKGKKQKPKYSRVTINGREYYKIKRKVGKKQATTGAWVDHYKEFYGATLKAATAKYEAYMRKQAAGDSRCFGEVINQWIDAVFLLDGNYKDSTKSRYLDAFRKNFTNAGLLGREITEIKGADIQAEYNRMTCGASTVKSCHKLLRLFFQYCEREGICTDKTRSLIPPAVSHKRKDQNIDTLTDSEISAILAGFNGHRLRLLIVLALATGARIGELLALKYDDITPEGVRINKQLQRKTGAGFYIETTKTVAAVRIVPLSIETREEIETHSIWHKTEMLSEGYKTPFIFTTKTGGHYDTPTVRKSCNRVYRKIGVREMGFHVYRHTFGSILANAGVPIQTVSKLMGHTDIGVTSKYYVNVGTDAKKAAINAMNQYMIGL